MDKRLKINLSVLSAPVALFALYTGAFTAALFQRKDHILITLGLWCTAVQAVHCIYLDYGEWCPLGLYDAAYSIQHSTLPTKSTQSMFSLFSEHSRYRKAVNVVVMHMVTAQT